MHFSKILIFAHGMKLKLGSVMIQWPSTKEAIYIILGHQNKVIYRLYIIFSKTPLAQLMASKINFICHRNIRSVSSNFIPCQEVEKWQWLIVSLWNLVKILWEIAAMRTEPRQISNLGNQDVCKEISSTLQKSHENIPSRFQVIDIFH